MYLLVLSIGTLKSVWVCLRWKLMHLFSMHSFCVLECIYLENSTADRKKTLKKTMKIKWSHAISSESICKKTYSNYNEHYLYQWYCNIVQELILLKIKLNIWKILAVIVNSWNRTERKSWSITGALSTRRFNFVLNLKRNVYFTSSKECPWKPMTKVHRSKFG